MREESVLNRLHPLTTALYFAAVMGIAMFAVNPVIRLCSFLCAALFMRTFGAGMRQSGIPGFVGFLAVAALVNPLFYHNGATVLFYLNGNRITLEAVRYGIGSALMLGGVLLWCQSLSSVFGSDHMLCLLGGISPKAALICSMSLRFFPMYARQMKKTKEQQRLLGLYGENTLIDRIRGTLTVFAAVTTWALEHSMNTADSMQARGYGSRRRTQYRRWRWRGRDALLTGVILGLTGAALAGIAAGCIRMDFYPVTDPVPMRAGSVAVYLCYAGVCSSLPVYAGIERRRIGGGDNGAVPG